MRELTRWTQDGAVIDLHHGMVVAMWTGARGRICCSTETWTEATSNDLWAAEITDMQQEAKRTMPKAVVRDVSVSAAMHGQTVVQPGHIVPTAQVGITALKAEIVRLVQDMAAYDHPTVQVQAEFGRRYGRYRDAMARLRLEFLEAEGAFEAAQAMLVEFMED